MHPLASQHCPRGCSRDCPGSPSQQCPLLSCALQTGYDLPWLHIAVFLYFSLPQNLAVPTADHREQRSHPPRSDLLHRYRLPSLAFSGLD